MRSRYDRLVPGRTALGAASFFRRIIISAEARCQVNRGINADVFAKTKELLRFIPFFKAILCLFLLGGHNFLMMIRLEKCCILHHRILPKNGLRGTRTGTSLLANWKSCIIVKRHNGALPRNPKFNALVFPETGKTSDEKSPPVSVQNPQDRSGCSSALPYPVLR